MVTLCQNLSYKVYKFAYHSKVLLVKNNATSNDLIASFTTFQEFQVVVRAKNCKYHLQILMQISPRFSLRRARLRQRTPIP